MLRRLLNRGTRSQLLHNDSMFVSVRAQSTASAPLQQPQQPALRPITALYGQHIYKLEALASMKSKTLYDVEPCGGSSSSGGGGEMRGGVETQEADASSTAAKRRKHVNKYMNPAAAEQRQAELEQLRQEGGRGAHSAASSLNSPTTTASPSVKKVPRFTIKPVMRYPTLQNKSPASAVGSGDTYFGGSPSASSFSGTPLSGAVSAGGGGGTVNSANNTPRKQQYLNVKAPELIIFEVVELGNEEAAPTASPVGSVVRPHDPYVAPVSAPPSSPPASSTSATVIHATHHIAVFNDGTIVGFGLKDDALRRIRSEVLDRHTEPKDAMLTADKEVIRLAARTNLCVFPAVDGDEGNATSGVNGALKTDVTSDKKAGHGTATTAAATTAVVPKRNRLRSVFPTSAAAIDRLAKNNAGTDISLRYRFTTAEDLMRADIVSTSASTSTSSSSSGNLSAAAPPPSQPRGLITTSYIDSQALEAVVLSENTAVAVLPFAFCFFELIQLRAFNALVFPIHEKVSLWQLHVAEKGTLPMSLKEARVMKAKLMRISSRQSKMTARRHRLLWEEHHTQARLVFMAAAEHFELLARNEGFKRRADGAQSSLAYLCDQAHFQKDVILEWVIIILITIEVYVAIVAHSHDYVLPPSTTEAAALTAEMM